MHSNEHDDPDIGVMIGGSRSSIIGCAIDAPASTRQGLRDDGLHLTEVRPICDPLTLTLETMSARDR